MKVCGKPGCTELTKSAYCTEHAPSWSGRNGSTSRQERGVTKSGWAEQQENQQVLRTHGAICYRCGVGGCTIVDHVVPRFEGGPDTVANKRPICERCHAEKSAAEAARARRSIRG